MGPRCSSLRLQRACEMAYGALKCRRNSEDFMPMQLPALYRGILIYAVFNYIHFKVDSVTKPHYPDFNSF